MKVALEYGETLDIALIEGERIVGTLSLQLKSQSTAQRVGRPAGSTSAKASSASEGNAATGSNGRKQRKPRKPMSDEARARMAAAQKARWAKRKK